MDVLLVAAKKEKIADYTGVIAQAGRSAVVVDVDAFALQNAYEVNYGIEPGAVVVLLNAGRQRDQHQHPQRRPVGLHPRHLDRRQRLHRGAAEGAQPSVRSGRPAQARSAGRRRHVRRRAPGAARRHRKRDARDPEDVRLLQGHRRVGSHRSHHAERRRLARRRLHRDAEPSASRRRSKRFDPFKRVAFDAKKFQVDVGAMWRRRPRSPSGSRSAG